MTTKWVSVLMLAAGLCAAAAHAQSRPADEPDAVLRSILDEARARNPELLAARALLAALGPRRPARCPIRCSRWATPTTAGPPPSARAT
jgi:hypothetical protein